jgi:N-acetylmuramoyl-L-alanine amidase
VSAALITDPPAVPTQSTATAAAAAAPIQLSAPPAFADVPAVPKKSPGGYSMARQLGLGVSRIVIDPGHGGHDPGAQGPSLQEAELVLNVALRLEKLLQDTPGTEVILTRRTDDFVSLPERTAIANRENADLFLSIHANASDRPTVSGVETYFLNFATTMSAASVAARENAASGQTMGALPDLVKAIALNNKLDESKDFASEVQRALVDRLRAMNKNLKDLRVKQAPFAVLIGAAMPSVLAEISFVTNAQEARLLRTNAYRQRIAEALFKAVRAYQTSLKNVGTVAHQ